jgi:hypothetical protein
VDVILITGGTPISERPKSFRNWLLSVAFRTWPQITQPQLEKFFALYSAADEVVDPQHATRDSHAKLILLEDFSHADFREPARIIPELKKLMGMVTK